MRSFCFPNISQAAGTATSFDSFKIVANVFLTYQVSAQDLPPSYYDCPVWCPETRSKCEDFCNQCPIKSREEEMRDDMTQMLDERLGDSWKKWGIDNLLKQVYEVSYLAEGSDADFTTTTHRLVTIYKGQQARIRRIEDYNRDQASKKRTR